MFFFRRADFALLMSPSSCNNHICAPFPVLIIICPKSLRRSASHLSSACICDLFFYCFELWLLQIKSQPWWLPSTMYQILCSLCLHRLADYSMALISYYFPSIIPFHITHGNVYTMSSLPPSSRWYQWCSSLLLVLHFLVIIISYSFNVNRFPVLLSNSFQYGLVLLCFSICFYCNHGSVP